MKLFLCLFAFVSYLLCACAAEPAFVKSGEKHISLPEPIKTGGMPLNEALAKRKTIREYAMGREFNLQELSNLLWAACGINRPDGRLTAPTARNCQEIDLYVCLPQGVYLYNKKEHSLELELKEDIRKQTGMQTFVGEGTIEIVMVADTTKMSRSPVQMLSEYGFIDSGYISQNIYLYAASENLATVVRGITPREQLMRLLNLPLTHFITVSQTVGFAK